ncbi:hypothetical protein AB4Z50_14790 [Paenibacillus sp. 2TAB26]|uniref:hypothetical protein n=1 Tax=Paenibacillus sp. 2TAB26 TaxID=3233005 RepID=UPI003F98DFED
MKPTDAVPGKPYVLKMKKDEDPLIFQWLNMQGIYSDSIRYLIEKEIAENGLRNLQHFIPTKRNIQSMKEQMIIPNHSYPNLYDSSKPNFQNIDPAASTLTASEEVISQHRDNVKEETKKQESNLPYENTSQFSKETTPKGPRKAGKNFGDDVLNSYK